MTAASEDKCVTCNQLHPLPDGTVPKHPFNDGSLGMSATFGSRRSDGSRSIPEGAQRGAESGSRGIPRPAMPLDPVLRQALIDKGVLTPQDLRDAENKINAITGMFTSALPTMRERNDEDLPQG